MRASYSSCSCGSFLLFVRFLSFGTAARSGSHLPALQILGVLYNSILLNCCILYYHVKIRFSNIGSGWIHGRNRSFPHNFLILILCKLNAVWGNNLPHSISCPRIQNPSCCSRPPRGGNTQKDRDEKSPAGLSTSRGSARSVFSSWGGR